jgi:hypothetical protein
MAMQIKAVGALMKAGDFTFKEAAQIMAKLDAEGLAIYKKKTPKLTRATIHKPS